MHSESLPPPPTRAPMITRAEQVGMRILYLNQDANGNPQPMENQFVDINTGQRHPDPGPERRFNGNHVNMNVKVSRANYDKFFSRNPKKRNKKVNPSKFKELKFRDQFNEEERAEIIEEQLLLEPIPPTSMNDEQAEKNKPKTTERSPSIHDKRLAINKLGRDRQTFKNLDKPTPDAKGRNPGDPEWEPTYELIKKTSSAWRPEFPALTTLTIDDMRDYIVDRDNGGAFDEIKDLYLERSQAEEKQKTSIGGKTVADLIALADKIAFATHPGGTERLESELNKLMADETKATTDTGPDERIRIIAARKNAKGIFVDYNDNPLTDGEVAVRNNVLKFVHHNPAVFQAFEMYELTKQQPHLTTRLWQDLLNVMIFELHYDEYTIGSVWHGMTYGRKYQDLTLKHSEIVHPIKLDENGQQIWKPVFDKQGNAVYEVDRHNRRVIKMEPVIDYHQVVIGDIKVQDFAVEYAARFTPGAMMFEVGEMQRQFELVQKLSYTLDDSYYFPGFYDSDGGIDARSYKGDEKPPIGRETKEYLTSLFAMSYIWMGINNLRMNPDLGDIKAGQTPSPEAMAQAGLSMAEIARMLAENSDGVKRNGLTAAYPPKMHGASAASNHILERMAKVADAVTTRHIKAQTIRTTDFSRAQ